MTLILNLTDAEPLQRRRSVETWTRSLERTAVFTSLAYVFTALA
jgi:hypothetical protein